VNTNLKRGILSSWRVAGTVKFHYRTFPTKSYGIY